MSLFFRHKQRRPARRYESLEKEEYIAQSDETVRKKGMKIPEVLRPMLTTMLDGEFWTKEEIANQLGISKRTIANYLWKARDCGIAFEETKKGRITYYRLPNRVMGALNLRSRRLEAAIEKQPLVSLTLTYDDFNEDAKERIREHAEKRGISYNEALKEMTTEDETEEKAKAEDYFRDFFLLSSFLNDLQFRTYKWLRDNVSEAEANAYVYQQIVQTKDKTLKQPYPPKEADRLTARDYFNYAIIMKLMSIM